MHNSSPSLLHRNELDLNSIADDKIVGSEVKPHAW
jgi:hypothetical protein